jgi:hypothetical protein
MASKTEQAMQKVATFLYDNPEPSGRAEIQTATGLSAQMTGRALATLVDSKAVVLDNTDGTDRWVWAQRPEPDQDVPAGEDESPAGERAAEEGGATDLEPVTEPEAEASGASDPVAEAAGEGQGEGEETGPVTEAADPEASETAPMFQDEDTTEVAEQAAEVDDGPASEAEAETAAPEGDATPEPDGAEQDRESSGAAGEEDEGEESAFSSTDAAGVNIQPVLLEHDPMVMLMARVLADATLPLTTRQVAEAAYMPMGTREVLTALRALHAAGLATCSKPFSPVDEDCTWQRQADLEPDAFMRSARGVPMAAAPDKVTCPTCGHSAAIPGVAKPRKRNSDLRSDGTRKLPPGGLKRLAKEWLSKPENAGVLITPGQLKRALIKAHGSTINPNCDGALRQLMADQFTKEDPTDADKRPLLVIEEGVTPLTYCIRDLA